MMDFIEMLRSKPEHIRKQVALAASGGITGVVALAWAIALISSGAFSLNHPVNDDAVLVSGTDTKSNSASALFGVLDALNGNGESITVVETESSSTLDAGALEERTVIPF